jgi:hypothetical protein
MLLLPAGLAAGSDSARLWQDGEIVSRKTVPSRRGGMEYRYVYRLESGSASYVVTTSEPLNVDLRVPVKICPAGKHMFIRETDGRERKVSMAHSGVRAVPWR